MQRKYSDGFTDITEPFWDNLCGKCGERFWSVTLKCRCPKCGNEETYIINAGKHTDRELEKFHKKRTHQRQ